MNRMSMFILAGLCCSVMLFQHTLQAQTIQTAYAESVPAQDNAGGNVNQADDEMVLEEIDVKGKVEKPGVIIMPKRIEPKLEEKDLERNFQKEINEENGTVFKPGSELRKVKRIKSIKSAIQKKRD